MVVGLCCWIGIEVVRRGFTPALLVWGGASAFLLLIMYYLIFRAVPKAGTVVVTVGELFIESPRFSTKEKKFAWADVLDFSLEAPQGQTTLRLQLRATADRLDKASFLNGANPARPLMLLNTLVAGDQEKLVDVIRQRISAQTGEEPEGAAAVNALREQRLFRDKLVALAPRTWVMYGLVTINCGVWLLMAAYGAGVAGGNAENLLMWGGNTASEVQQGQWWRLLSATFLHSGFLHLFMNMLGLVSIGLLVERLYGHKLFLLIYIGAGLLGSATSLHFSALKAVSVGASGAVFGVAGALLMAFFKHRGELPKLMGKRPLMGLGFFILYSMMQGFATVGVDNAAHVGGLLAGMALAAILPTRLDAVYFASRVKGRTAMASALIVLAVAGAVMSAPRAPFDVSESFAASAALRSASNGFLAAWKEVEQDAKDVKDGKRTDAEADERTRTVHAPRVQKVLQQLSAISLSPNDPSSVLLRDFTRLVALLHESLAMDSIVVDGKILPADGPRAKAIEREVTQLNESLPKLAAQLSGKTKR